MPDLKLVNVYSDGGIRPGAAMFLYELMKEREPEINISHKELPSWEDHISFIESHPFRVWYLLEKSEWVGYVSLTWNNEIGIVIRKACRGQGIGPEAVSALIKLHKPNSAVPGLRNGHWLANIAPDNHFSKRMFEKLGFRKIQETYQLEEDCAI